MQQDTRLSLRYNVGWKPTDHPCENEEVHLTSIRHPPAFQPGSEFRVFQKLPKVGHRFVCRSLIQREYYLMVLAIQY